MTEPIFATPPGWPQPPAGWRPPAGWQPDPSWPPAPAGWVFWVDPVTGAPAQAPAPAAATPGAPPAKRRGKTLAIVLSVIGGLLVLLIAAPFIVLGIAKAANPDAITSVDDAVAAYEEQSATIRQYVIEHPWGYAEAGFTDELLDDELAAELASSSPDIDEIVYLAHTVEATRLSWEPLVAAWEIEYAAKPENSGNTSGTDAEAALDAISGGVSELIPEPGPCGDATVAACVFGGTTVYVNPELAQLTDAELLARSPRDWEGLMMHEYAHVIQNKYLFRLTEHPDYVRLFEIAQPEGTPLVLRYALEHSADCMAAVRIPGYVNGYPGDCTPEQLAFAETIWDGSFHQP